MALNDSEEQTEEVEPQAEVQREVHGEVHRDVHTEVQAEVHTEVQVALDPLDEALEEVIDAIFASRCCCPPDVPHMCLVVVMGMKACAPQHVMDLYTHSSHTHECHPLAVTLPPAYRSAMSHRHPLMVHLQVQPP